MKRSHRAIIITCSVGALAFTGVSWIAADRLTAPIRATVGAPPADLPCESVTLTSSDSLKLRGWYVPGADGATAVVLLHGLGGNRTHMLERARMLHAEGYGALLYDARASGESDGEMISMGYYERRDLIAAIGWLRARGVGRIACIGVSLGGATIAMAGEQLEGIRCVILESAYDRMRTAIDRLFRLNLGIPGWLGGALMIPFGECKLGCSVDSIAPLAHMARIPCPVMIADGDRDPRVPIEDTRRLFDAAREPKELWLVPGAGHVDLRSVDAIEYDKRVLAFLRKWM